MDVEIDGARVRLEQRQVIGVGGEGTVFLATVGGQPQAVKVYHTPTRQRQEKLRAFLASNWHIPRSRVALPLQLVRDTRGGEIIGLSMPYIGSGIEEIARLANKKQRTASLISTRDVVSIFLDGAATLDSIHQSGLVVGDLNDQNVLYKGTMMLWVDVDAWQFAAYPCPVATEDFIAPELYDTDLSLKPVFAPEHDWYAFAVHLFRSLLLVHPYGGTHKEHQALTRRARHRIFVLGPGVIYPRIACAPELLSDELAEVFERIFAGGWRGRFPRTVLQKYLDSLVECTSCAMHYPQSRRVCPLCQAKTIAVIQQPHTNSAGARVTDLIWTRGKIVFAKLQGEAVHALAYEEGKAVLYTSRPGLALKRVELFKEIASAHYDLSENILIVNQPQTTGLLFIDIAGEKPVPICQAETAIFVGSRRAMFQAANARIFSIVNNALMCGDIEEGELSGRALRTVMENQTWFTAAPVSEDGRPTIFGFFQVFRQQLYWLIRDRAVYDVALPELHPEEALLDIAAYFSGEGACIRRHTHERGIDYLRTEIIDNRGKVVHSGAKTKRADHPCGSIHGKAYAAGILLHATDGGIVQENIGQRAFKTFPATRDLVQDGDTLEAYRSGLLVIREERVSHLIM